MIVSMKNLSKEELVIINENALNQISKLVDENKKLQRINNASINQISNLIDENKRLRAAVRKTIESGDKQESCLDD